MAGTIVFTAANSSLAIPAVEHLLKNYPNYTAVLTVRNAADTDVNTQRLRATIAKYPGANTFIHELDLADLSAVHAFADRIADQILQGSLPPLTSLICNAYHWNLSSALETTGDGYEKSFQVIHVAHAALVLRLLGNFGPGGGRVVLFSSDAHWPGKNGLEKYPPVIPNDLELLVKPHADAPPPDNFGRGFQRYASSKLAVVMWMYALNRYLENDPRLSNITAVAINPGNLSDSRALRTNTPTMLVFMSRFVIQPLRPLLRLLMDPTMRTSAEAGADVVDLATGAAHPNERGYFTLLERDSSAPDSMNEGMQRRLWTETLRWARITKENTAMAGAFALQLTGDYHDLKITCQGSEWKVHRAVLCARSKVFKKACQPGFKEADLSNPIKLDDLHPIMVEKLIHYLYNSDYDDTVFPQENEGEDNDDLALKATQEGEEGKETTEGMNEETGQDGKVNEEEESGWRIDEEDLNEGAKEEPDWQKSQLLALNVGMYVIGDRFDLSQLRDLAKEKFSAALIERWNQEDLAEVIRTIYDNTMPSDRPLRDCLVPTLQQNRKALRENEDFMNLVKTHGDFAVDLVDAWGNPGDLEKIQLSCRKRHNGRPYASQFFATYGHDGVVACPSCDVGLSYTHM
ncbi:MAG: hypothetical protein Q9173_003122 [Seirophora scorigena]